VASRKAVTVNQPVFSQQTEHGFSLYRPLCVVLEPESLRGFRSLPKLPQTLARA